MKKLKTQNKALSQKQSVYSKLQVDTPTFTPVSNTFSQLKYQLAENPEQEQKNQPESMDITQQNLLNESNGEWKGKIDESQNKCGNARVVYFPYKQSGSDQVNKDEQLLISECDGQNDLVINSELYHSQPENAHHISKYTQYGVRDQNKIPISNQKQMRSSTIPQSITINASYPPQTMSVTDQNAIQLQNAHRLTKELNADNEKCLEYEAVAHNQAQCISRLQEQARWNRQQLESYKMTWQAKMEACLEVKDLEMLRLKQQISDNRKIIEKLEQKIKNRSKIPNIMIEQYQRQSKTQRNGRQNLKSVSELNQKIQFQLSESIRVSNHKISSLTQEIYSLKYINSELRAHISILQSENRQLKHQISEINNTMAIRQNKVKKIMQKQLNKIRELGAQVVGIAQSQLCHKRRKTNMQKISHHGEDNKMK